MLKLVVTEIYCNVIVARYSVHCNIVVMDTVCSSVAIVTVYMCVVVMVTLAM